MDTTELYTNCVQIISFFGDIQDHPGEYGVEAEHRDGFKAIVEEIKGLMYVA